MSESDYTVVGEHPVDEQYWTDPAMGQIRAEPEFVCGVADALEPDDEVIINSRERTLTVLGFEEQLSPGVINASDYPYHILWLRGNGTEYRMRWSHLSEYYPNLHTESELETYESYSVKHGEPRKQTRSTTSGKRVRWLKPIDVDKEELPDWVLGRSIERLDGHADGGEQ